MPKIRVLGRKLAPHEDFYHWVLTLDWRSFFAAVAIAFFLLNAAFAMIYGVSPGCISNASGFGDLFFFSVQTLATIGYGSMAPQTRFGHVVVSVEALVGILCTAVVTGLTFVRIARPTARIVFTDKAVIMKRNGIPHLMFRLANWRRNQVVEAQLHVAVLLSETTEEGEKMRRPHPLKLVRSTNPMFALSWTAMHMIDETSPFFGPDAFARLREQGAELFLSVSGLDETIAQTIHARYRYTLDDVVQNARFADILVTDDNGVRVLDFDKFHEIIPLGESQGDITQS
jgi:inward rectifier potassium channel